MKYTRIVRKSATEQYQFSLPSRRVKHEKVKKNSAIFLTKQKAKLIKAVNTCNWKCNTISAVIQKVPNIWRLLCHQIWLPEILYKKFQKYQKYYNTLSLLWRMIIWFQHFLPRSGRTFSLSGKQQKRNKKFEQSKTIDITEYVFEHFRKLHWKWISL